MADEPTNEPMPVHERTVPQNPPPLPGATAAAPAAAAKPAAAAATAKPAPSPATLAAITAIQAAEKLVAALVPATNNTRVAQSRLNDAVGLLQK